MMVPKYTLKMDLTKGDNEEDETIVMDIDYTNLKRIQGEIEEALKSVDSTYSKKVLKFLK